MTTEPDALSQLVDCARVAQTMPRDLPSPCISVCRVDTDRGLCEGCLRTLDEIAGWSRMADDGKRVIWRAIELRALQAYKQGTARREEKRMRQAP